HRVRAGRTLSVRRPHRDRAHRWRAALHRTGDLDLHRSPRGHGGLRDRPGGLLRRPGHARGDTQRAPHRTRTAGRLPARLSSWLRLCTSARLRAPVRLRASARLCTSARLCASVRLCTSAHLCTFRGLSTALSTVVDKEQSCSSAGAGARRPCGRVVRGRVAPSPSTVAPDLSLTADQLPSLQAMAPCQTEFSEACLESSGVHAVACPESAFSVLISIGPGSGCSTELRTLSVHTGVALIHNSRALVPHRSESIHKVVHSWG